MIGVCSGKVRSTPTPKETLRTVKVRPTPEPWTRMQMPWNTWTRERLPSTTLTSTLRVSPARNSGRSSRLVAAASVSMTLVMISPRGRHRSPTERGWFESCAPSAASCGTPPVAGGPPDPSQMTGERPERNGCEEQVCHSGRCAEKSSSAAAHRLAQAYDAGLVGLHDVAPVARLLVHPQVVRAGRPGEQLDPAGVGRSSVLDVPQQPPPEAVAPQVGDDHQPADVPDVVLEAATDA